MDWGNEPYVRLYTRDTAAWIALPWQARAVFYEIKRKVDRAGVLKVGRRGVATLPEFLRLPVEVVQVGVDALLEEGAVVDGGDRLTIPDHIDSEESDRSDAARQRDLRERRRDKALASGATPEEARVAARPDRYSPPRLLGVGHDGSHGVTTGHSLLCLALPSLPSGSLRSPSQRPPTPSATAPPTRRVNRAPPVDAVELAEQLRDAVLAVKPNARCGDPKAWASSREPWARKLVPLLRERDRAALERAIAFYPTQAGGPYSLVVESAASFAEKLDRLEHAMARAATPKANSERFHMVREGDAYGDPEAERRRFLGIE